METITNLFKVLWAPRKVLSEIAQHPRIIAPLLLLTLFAAVQTVGVLAKLDPGALRLQEFERGGYADKISESDKAIHAEAARSNRGLAFFFPTIGPAFIVLVTACVFFLILGLGRGVSFSSFLAVTAFAFIPRIFHSIATLVTIFVVVPTPETLLWASVIGPIRFLDGSTMSRVVYLSLSAIDVISFWIVALLVFGYGLILRDRIKPAVCAAAVVGVYLAWCAVYVGLLRLFLG